jgi:hypothetical protein
MSNNNNKQTTESSGALLDATSPSQTRLNAPSAGANPTSGLNASASSAKDSEIAELREELRQLAASNNAVQSALEALLGEVRILRQKPENPEKVPVEKSESQERVVLGGSVVVAEGGRSFGKPTGAEALPPQAGSMIAVGGDLTKTRVVESRIATTAEGGVGDSFATPPMVRRLESEFAPMTAVQGAPVKKDRPEERSQPTHLPMERTREAVSVTVNGYRVTIHPGSEKVKDPHKEDQFKMPAFTFSGTEKNVFQGLNQLLFEVARMVDTHGFTKDIALAMLRANLAGEAKELAYTCQEWTSMVSRLLTRYATPLHIREYKIWAMDKMDQKRDETAFAFLKRMERTLSCLPGALEDKELIDEFARRLRPTWTTANPILVSKIANCKVFKDVESLLVGHEENPDVVLSVRAPRTDPKPASKKENPKSKTGKQGPKQKGTCWTCGKEGHKQSDCPNKSDPKDKDGNGKSPDPKGSDGKSSPAKKNNGKKNVRFQNGRNGNVGAVNDGKPRGQNGAVQLAISLVTTAAEEIDAMLDSGTPIHLMSEEDAIRHRLPIEYLPEPHLYGSAAKDDMVEVIGDATMNVLWGRGVRAIDFRIAKNASQILLAYLGLPGENDWAHTDGITKRLVMDGAEWTQDPSTKSWRLKSLTDEQKGALAGASVLEDRRDVQFASKWLNPESTPPTHIVMQLHEPADKLTVELPLERPPPLIQSSSDEEVQAESRSRRGIIGLLASSATRAEEAEMPHLVASSDDEGDQDEATVGDQGQRIDEEDEGIYDDSEHLKSLVGAVLRPNDVPAVGITSAGAIEVNISPGMRSEMTPAQDKRLVELLERAARNAEKLERDPIKDRGALNFDIELKPGAKPRFEPRRPMNPRKKEAAYATFRKLNALGKMVQLKPEQAQHISNFTFPVKSDDTLRPCGDYRVLNDMTVPLPNGGPSVEELKSQMSPKAKYFGTADMTNGFHSVPATDRAIPLLCVWGPEGEIWAYTAMPFGCVNASEVFRRLTRFIFDGLESTHVYVDDVNFEAESIDGLLDVLESIIDRMEKHGVGMHPKKLYMGERIPCLGAIRTRDGFVPDPKKLDVLYKVEVPTTQTGVRQVRGMFQYLSNHVNAKLAVILKPLNQMASAKHGAKLSPGEIATVRDVLQRANDALVESVALVVPDYEKEFVIQVDASNDGVGGYLYQLQDDGKEGIIRCWSKAFAGSQENWSTFKKEAYAIMYALDQCASYVAGSKFRLLTDHRPLIWVFRTARKAEGKGTVHQWAVLLDSFRMSVEHIAGTKNVVADALSRQPYAHPVSGGGVEERNVEIKRIELGSERVIAPVFLGNNAAEVDAMETAELQDYLVIPSHPYDITKGDAFEIIARHYLSGGTDATLSEELSQSPVLKDVRKHLPDLDLIGGRLRHAPSGGYYVPIMERDRVLLQVHNAPYAGHFGPEKTMSRLEGLAWWPSMRSAVEEHCRLCGHCQRRKPKPGLKAQENALPPVGVWERVHVDVITMPLSMHGNRYILNLVDSMSKKQFAYAMRTKTASEASIHLFRLFNDVGFPLQLTTDRGGEFVNEMLEQLCAQFGIMHHKATACHHQSNGQVEVANRILEERLAMHTNADQSDWDDWLDDSLAAINNARPLNGAQSPNTVWFGRRMRGTLDFMLGANEPEGLDKYEALRRTLWIREETSRLEGLARSSNLPSVPAKVTAKVGDLVLVRFKGTKPGKSKKLLPRQQGPYRIVRIDNNSVAELESVEHSSDKLRRHLSDLTRYHGKPGSVEPEDEFEVEKIIAERREGENVEYLLRWAGYGRDHDTWRSAKDIPNAMEVIERWRAESPASVPSVVHRVIQRENDRFLVALGDDHGPEDYVWVRSADVANPAILEAFREVPQPAMPAPVTEIKKIVEAKKPTTVEIAASSDVRRSQRSTKGTRSDSKYLGHVQNLGEVIADRYDSAKK